MLPVVLAVPTAVGAISTDVQPAGFEVSVDHELEPRGSILIDGDEELANHPAVREGSGTGDDPFVIRDHVIHRSHQDGILLNGTEAHVSLERLVVLPCLEAEADCLIGESPRAFHLRQVANVSVESLTVLPSLGRGEAYSRSTRPM